jgi:hypothetical protein
MHDRGRTDDPVLVAPPGGSTAGGSHVPWVIAFLAVAVSIALIVFVIVFTMVQGAHAGYMTSFVAGPPCPVALPALPIAVTPALQAAVSGAASSLATLVQAEGVPALGVAVVYGDQVLQSAATSASPTIPPGRRSPAPPPCSAWARAPRRSRP